MIAAGPILADLFLSVAAVIGLITLQRIMSSRGAWEPLNRRFLFGINVMIALFASRAFYIISGVGLFYVTMMIAAALIPVVVLILTEGLLRRHAPRWAKALVALGAVLFGLWALLPGGSEWRLYGLLIFQTMGLCISGWLVLTRDKSSLSSNENRAVERLGISLILLVPLAAVDFLTVKLGIPVQASPLAVLFLCWLAIGLGGPEARHRGSLFGFGAVVLSAVCAAIFVAIVWQLGRDGSIVAGAVILSAMLAGAVVNEARHLRAETQNLSMLRQLAEAKGTATRFLRGLAEHPMVEGAVFIGEEALLDLDRAALTDLFQAHPVLRKSNATLSGEQADYAAHLFARYDASHIFWVSGSPLRLVALSMPSVVSSSSTELELAAVQRMAALMAREEEQ